MVVQGSRAATWRRVVSTRTVFSNPSAPPFLCNLSLTAAHAHTRVTHVVPTIRTSATVTAANPPPSNRAVLPLNAPRVMEMDPDLRWTPPPLEPVLLLNITSSVSTSHRLVASAPPASPVLPAKVAASEAMYTRVSVRVCLVLWPARSVEPNDMVNTGAGDGSARVVPGRPGQVTVLVIVRVIGCGVLG